jgi:cell wall-associated NlpC family hydrolase
LQSFSFYADFECLFGSKWLREWLMKWLGMMPVEAKESLTCMTSVDALQSQLFDPLIEYETTQCLDLYDSEALQALATQARIGLHVRILPSEVNATALQVVVCQDDYPGWMAVEALQSLQKASQPYRPISVDTAEIQARIPAVIAFTQAAMAQANVYLWGGTVGPNYDCSGLVQHAFSSQGIWLPRDAYQQEAFVQPLKNPGARPEDLVQVLEPGDLIFFGTPIKATHVALYLGAGDYIHSSGIAQGRNGIGIDSLTNLSEVVSQNYYAQFRGAGRVVESYLPGN